MPTYDYRCGACGHEFEAFQSITAKPLRKCPECGHNTLSRLIGTGGGIIFKGSGFYQTDYRTESYRKAAQADKSPASTPKDTAKKPATDKPKKTAKAGSDKRKAG